MAGLAEKLSFIESHVLPELSEFTLRFLTPIIGVKADGSGDFLGTGVFCQIRGHHAVVTAAHTLDSAQKTGSYRSLAIGRGEGVQPSIVPGKIIYGRESDVAVYLPEQDLGLGLDKAFWPGSSIDEDDLDLSREYLFLQGYPQRYARSTALIGRTFVFETLAYGTTMKYRVSDIPASERGDFDHDLPDYDFLPEEIVGSNPHQFAVVFSTDPSVVLDPASWTIQGNPRTTEDLAQLFAPAENHDRFEGQSAVGAFGLSGSPVWRVGATNRKMAEWSVDDCRLIGFVSKWNVQHQILIVTRISQATGLVVKDHAKESVA